MAAARAPPRRSRRSQQVLSVTDSATGCEVLLVACMHFNPRSVERAASVTRGLAEEGALGAVVLETCPSRWRKVEAMQPPGSLLRGLLDNEMQAAAEEAEAAGRPVVLGDRRVEELLREVRSLAVTAASDLASPMAGGWQRTAQEIARGLSQVAGAGRGRPGGREDGGEKGGLSDDRAALGVEDLLDVQLALGVPVAVFRYVLSTALKAPAFAAAVAAYFALVGALPDSPVSDAAGLALDVLTLRVLLGAVLRDRDEVLARSVRSACGSAGRGRAVVAVLGAAHCNGVRLLLRER
uniref:TraB domain-containing protein n=1 Tax=Alexandrium monilatum TaxID=311494 RepID=A0A7S4PU89_9DINO